MDSRNPQAPYRCDSCGEETIRKRAEEAVNVWRRVEPGGTYTDRECHKCGALMYPVSFSLTWREKAAMYVGFYTLREIRSRLSDNQQADVQQELLMERLTRSLFQEYSDLRDLLESASSLESFVAQYVTSRFDEAFATTQDDRLQEA
jgi:predicted RNA-binding Zn-ribbon protein involved in translation (DUF1610 family)